MKRRFFLVPVLLTVLTALLAGCSTTSALSGVGLSFTVKAQNSEIWLWNQKTDKLHNLTNRTGDDFWQSWSPDGKYMAFSSDRSGELEISILNLDKSETFNFSLSPTSDDGWPAWSPDGETIAYSSDRDGNYDIWLQKVDGSGSVNLTKGTGDDGMPAWSPDSKKLAFISNRTGNNEIFIIGADGLLPKQITNDEGEDLSPVWSPDGKKLAFVTKRDQNNEIYIYDLETEQAVNVTNNLGNDELRSGPRTVQQSPLFRIAPINSGTFTPSIRMVRTSSA